MEKTIYKLRGMSIFYIVLKILIIVINLDKCVSKLYYLEFLMLDLC